MIDLSVLDRALATLQAGLDALAKAPDDAFIRDACIKRFEYCYELSHKTLRRYLRETEPADGAELTFPSMIRLGFSRGLLPSSWDVWTDFRDARNNTSHTYDEAKAKKVVALLARFFAEASHLHDEIARRQAA